MYILGNNYKSAKLEKWKLVFRKLIPQMFAEKDPQILPILIESISTLGSNVFSELEVCIIFLKMFNIQSNTLQSSAYFCRTN